MKNLLNKIVFIIAAFCLTVTLFYNPADVYAASGSVTFGSESYEAENNSQFQIGVYLKADSGMGSYHVELEYDNSRMDYVSGAESEANGVITMEGIAVSNEVKYMLSFKTKSGGDAYVKIKNAIIYTSTAGSTEKLEIAQLPEVAIKISGEDTGSPRQEEQPQQQTQYTGPFETDVPHLEPAIKMNNTDYYVVDSNQSVSEKIGWSYKLVPGKLGNLDVMFISNEANDIFMLELVNSNGEISLYSYSNSKKQLFDCKSLQMGSTTYIYTSPYASDNLPKGMTERVINHNGIVYAVKSDGESGFYTVESGKLKIWNPQKTPENTKITIIKKAAMGVVLVLVILVALYFVIKEIKAVKRRRGLDFDDDEDELEYDDYDDDDDDPYAAEFEITDDDSDEDDFRVNVNFDDFKSNTDDEKEKDKFEREIDFNGFISDDDKDQDDFESDDDEEPEDSTAEDDTTEDDTTEDDTTEDDTTEDNE